MIVIESIGHSVATILKWQTQAQDCGRRYPFLRGGALLVVSSPLEGSLPRAGLSPDSLAVKSEAPGADQVPCDRSNRSQHSQSIVCW